MFVIKANITFTEVRKSPICKGYRPILFFPKGISRTSWLEIEECIEMNKSYKNIILKIYVYKDLVIEDTFFVGQNFLLGDPIVIIGGGKIIEVIGDEHE